MGDALRLALGTLTAVRVSPPGSMQAPVPGRAMALAPVVGLVPGAAAAAAAGLALLIGFRSGVTAVIVVGLFALTTRGLHLDGLADTADGLAASYDPSRALEVMRRGDTGPNGLATVVLVLLLQCAALAEVLQGPDRSAPAGAVVIVVLVAVAARAAIPAACRRGVPAARAEGLGATVAGSVSPTLLGAVLLAAGTACSLAGLAAGFDWWAGALAVVLVAVSTGLLVQRAVARFGGITGDVIGAAVEIGTAAALLTLAAAGYR